MAEAEAQQPRQETQVTLIFDHPLTDAEVEQLKSKTGALDARMPGFVSPQGFVSPRVVVGNYESIPPGEDAFAEVTCPAGYFVAGGGGQTTDGTQGVLLSESVPSPQGGSPYVWRVGYKNTTAFEYSIRAYAVCLRNVV